MRSPREDRRVLCTLRDALPVWDVGRGGLRDDCEIVRSRAPPLLAYVSQGAVRAHRVDLVTLVSENYFVSPLSTGRLAGNYRCEADVHTEARLGAHLSRSISHAGSRRSNSGCSHHRWQQVLGELDSGASSSPMFPSYDCWDLVPMPRYTNSCAAVYACETWVLGFNFPTINEVDVVDCIGESRSYRV